MSKKTKSSNPLTSWFLNSELFQNPIAKTYRKKAFNILSNLAYRLIYSFVVLAVIVASFYMLTIISGQINSWFSQLIALGFFVALIYLPVKYLYVSINQIIAESSVNFSISNLKWAVYFLRKNQKGKHYRSLQAKMSRLRTNLLDFLEYSEILSPPIFNYELNRLKKRIDIFFNSASETLVPITKLFSRSEEFQEEIAQAQYYDVPLSPDEEEAEIADERMKEVTGEIEYFDFGAMDDFLNHLWDALFEREEQRYSPFPFKHPVNLILLSRFFDSWNKKIGSLPNSKANFEKASKDIEEYYKSVGELESERRQRRWRLRDDVVVVLVSVGLSTLVQYIISIT